MNATTACLACGSTGRHGRSGRCAPCRLARQRAKDATPERRAQKAKYDAGHRQLRQAWVRPVSLGVVICARCGRRIEPTSDWHLGHQDDGSESRPEHAVCNLVASNDTKEKT